MTESSLDLFKSLGGELDPELLQKKFLLSLLKLHNVKRGSIWIKTEDRYQCIEAVGAESENIKGVYIDMTHPSIVGWVIENGKMTVADTNSDARHYKELEENLAVKSHLILCFPLFLREQTVYGAVQIIDTSAGTSHLNLDRSYLNHIQGLVDIGSVALSNAILYSEQLKEKESLKNVLKEIQGEKVIIGRSNAFQQTMSLVRSYSNSDFHVLITGESGTGKELIAQEIHRLGARRHRPFLVQNCSVIPEPLLASELFGYKKGAFSGAVKEKIGLFEAADGGTVFLDEIGDMPMNIQASILRVLQNNEVKPLGANRVRHVNVRIISATNREIKQMVADNTFRQDLFYRLSILPVHLPPLRERMDDIPLLINYFLKQESIRTGVKEKKLRAKTMGRLMTWSWPGNIRELENLVKYLMVVTDELYVEPESIGFHFPMPEHSGPLEPDSGTSGHSPGKGEQPYSDGSVTGNGFENLTWHDLEENYILFLLNKNNWNITWAARDAALNRSTFASKMRRLGIRKNRIN